MLGGETAILAGGGDIIRGVEKNGFDTRIAPQYAGPIASLGGTALTDLRSGMVDGRYDAWLLHLAEGVRDADRRPGDPFSSRGEFATLKA